MSLPLTLKRGAGRALAGLDRRCNYDNCLFVLGHMRCGSTAISNILVSRPDVSGYGEAHVAYSWPDAPGQLALNQLRRGSYRPGARLYFDKILHNRYDGAADAGFFRARAIFVARTPEESILSIRDLFTTLGSTEYASDAVAVDYLLPRMQGLAALWARFRPERRLAVTHAQLVNDPVAVLARVSALADFEPALENAYAAKGRQAPGAGDPLAAHRYDRIVAGRSASSLAGKARSLEIPGERLQALHESFEAFGKLCTS